MPSNLPARLDGELKIRLKIARFGAKQEAKRIKKALRAAANVVKPYAKIAAPKQSGKLAKEIRVRGGKSRDGAFSMLVSIGKKFFQGETFYGGFVVFGHKIGKRKSKGKGAKASDTRKEVKGNDFLQRALKFSAGRAEAAFKRSLKASLEEANQ